MEERLLEIESVLSEKDQGCDYSKDLQWLIDSGYDGTDVSELQSEIMTKTNQILSDTRLLDLIYTVQSVSSSVALSQKKYKYSRSTKSGLKERHINLSLDNIKGKLGVVLTNLNGSEYDVRDKTCLILGDMIDNRMHIS